MSSTVSRWHAEHEIPPIPLSEMTLPVTFTTVFPWPVVEARLLVRDGMSPGKRLSGLAVVTGDGSVPGWPSAVARSLAAWSAPALVVLLTGWVVIAGAAVVLYGPALLTGGRAGLGDLAAGTRVVFRGDVRDD